MNNIPNKKTICDVLCSKAASDKDIVVLCSDSRGSASMTPFFEAYPGQAIEVGIAEQNLVSMASGLAACGKKPYVFSPACFLSARSYEQIKIDCSYSNNNVKLIGISGGVSYGALGMSHHSLQDIAALSAIPNMRVYLPSDRFQTAFLIESLLKDDLPAYVRVGRNAVEDIYSSTTSFVMDKAVVHRTHDKADIVIIACGEMVEPSLAAAGQLAEEGIYATVVDMFCLKPLDEKAVLDTMYGARAVLTVEEHSPYGGLGARICQVVAARYPKRVCNMALPDSAVVTGASKEVFAYYNLTAEGIAEKAKNILR